MPAGVELGYHLCYGSPQDEHLVQPKDAAILVEMMEGIAAATQRRIDFFHIPVPKDRTDDAYYAPLEGLEAADRHQALSRTAASRRRRRRQDAHRGGARHVVDDFGLSAECGWGRTQPGRLPGLLKGHRIAAEAL